MIYIVLDSGKLEIFFISIYHFISLFVNYRCGVEVRIWRSLMAHRRQFTSITDEFGRLEINTSDNCCIDGSNDDDINRNIQQQQHQYPPRITFESPSPQLPKSGSNSKCNSIDLNHRTSSSSSSDAPSDYESCNGGLDDS